MTIFPCPTPWLPVVLTLSWAFPLGMLLGSMGMRWAQRHVHVERVHQHSQSGG